MDTGTRNWLFRLDWFLIACAAGVLAIGLAYVASATMANSGGGMAARQALYVAIGVVAMVVMLKVDYLKLLHVTPLLYLVCLLLLCGVFLTRPVNGARSWYDLRLFKFQPSELMKIVIVLTLAHYLMYRDSYKRLTGLMVPLVLTAVPMALILKEPDMGTTMVFGPVFLAMLFAAGAKIRHLGLMGLATVACSVAMWFTVMKEYQKRRIFAWLYPDEYRTAEAWQLLQSQVAIGSGGWWGTGWGDGVHNRLSLLPEKHTDFIFAVIAEEGGVLTALLLMLLFFLIALGGLGIAARTREPAGRLIAVGLASLLCSQVLINVCVALGLLPTTGLTLPLVSYGGSSMVASFMALGLLLNVGSRQEPVLAQEDFG